MVRGRKKTHVSQRRQREATSERERLERFWHGRLTERPELGPLVTGQQLQREPFHRWLPYRQGFAPALVRLFLEETRFAETYGGLPLLDPFSGSGTVVVEAARQEVPALGVEALPALAFVARQKGAREFVKAPRVEPDLPWKAVAQRLTEPLHRAALICAVAARHTADGRLAKDAPPLVQAFAQVLIVMKADLQRPLPRSIQVETGDARSLSTMEPASIGGILTSPPYLSRYDYTRTNRPLNRVYRYWYPSEAEAAATQVRAHPEAPSAPESFPMPPAVAEIVSVFRERQMDRLADVVRAYFADMAAALQAWKRVLPPGGICWMVVGGARLRGVYVPSDLIIPELAGELELVTEGVHVARRLIGAGRKLGSLEGVAPRESILIFRKST